MNKTYLKLLCIVAIIGVFTALTIPNGGEYEKSYHAQGIEPSTSDVTDEEFWQEEIRNNPEEFLYERLLMEGIEEPDIVYAIARLETGNFTSRICTEDNNLFGLYDSVNQEYYKYDDWRDSVKAYKELIESKYKGGDYYKFLKNLPYSEDAEYIGKVRKLVVQMRRI